MMTRTEIIDALRATHPQVEIGGEIYLPGSAEFEAYIAEQADRWEARQARTQVPVEVTPRQFRLALIGAGLDLATIDAAVTAAGDAARVEWEYASSIKRAHPMIASLGEQLGKTSEQIDAIFVAAAAL